MKLLCRFFDRKGCSLASPHVVEGDASTVYATAQAFRQAVEDRRGVKVYLHTEEQP